MLLMKSWTTLRSRKARIEDISKPPIGGIIPLKRLRYGSVIEQIAERTPLDQSILGNQVKRTLTIRIKEYICNVCPKTSKIAENEFIFLINIHNTNIYFFDSPILDKNSLLTANVWKNLSDNDSQ